MAKASPQTNRAEAAELLRKADALEANNRGGDRFLTQAVTDLRRRAKELLPHRRHLAEPGECAGCDIDRKAGNTFHPSHDPSPHCESNGHPHCSCDLCF